MPYSRELIEQTQKYFACRGEVLSDEQTMERLNALADLYGVMEKVTASALEGDAVA